MKTIELTQGKVAIVDDADFEWLRKFKWSVMKKVRKCGVNWYAVRNGPRINGKRQGYFLMHRDIALRAGFPKVDHADGDGLNNQRSNLRPCTNSQNQANRRRAPGGSGKYKGVSWCGPAKKWRARIMVDYKERYLGVFSTQEAALAAYREAAVTIFGEFAKIV